MIRRFNVITVLLGFVAITTQRHVRNSLKSNQLREIDRLLHSLDDSALSASQKGHHYHGSDKHTHRNEDDHKNLMNIQTLNVILKNNLRKTPAANDHGTEQLFKEVERALREAGDDNDDDRCGCGRSRLEDLRCGCGSRGRSGLEYKLQRDDDDVNYLKDPDVQTPDYLKYLAQHGKRYKISNDLDAVVVDVAHLEKLLDGNQRKSKEKSLKCQGPYCGRQGYSNKNRDDDDSLDSLDVLILDDTDTNSKGKSLGLIKCSGSKCAVLDKSDENEAEYSDKNDLDDLQALIKLGKKYAVNENIDAVVLDVADLDQLNDRSEKRNKDRKLQLDNELNLLQNPNMVLLDLDKIQTADNYDKDDFPVTNELVNLLDDYRSLSELKQELVDDIVDYIEGRKSGIVYNFLSDKQKSMVNDLKRKLRKTSRPNRTLQYQVEDILFSGQSSERTNLAKVRKQKAKKPSFSVASHSLRRRQSDDGPDGIPFELALQGLAQVNA